MTDITVVPAIQAKLLELRDSLAMVSDERISISQSIGRILSRPILATRDSPADNVSAMDGYAVRLDDLGNQVPIQATIYAGSKPVPLEPRMAIRILTGAVVPTGAEVVVRKEDTVEQDGLVEFSSAVGQLKPGVNIRFQGENARAGDAILPSGELIGPHTLAGIATFSDLGIVDVFQRLRITILNTGDELVLLGEPLASWQIRDSNGPFLESALQRHAWCELQRRKVPDRLDAIEEQLKLALTDSHAVLLTGGVSMGETDYVPRAVQNAGGRIVFHRIPIRPGKPLMGASTSSGQLIMGLPGNPLSVAVTWRRYALPLLLHMAGLKSELSPYKVETFCDDNKTIDLTWFRLVTINPEGKANIIPSQGSGDIASLSRSHGFVEIPPGEMGRGFRSYYPW
ncbi:MAG: molybdopterin molybdotransferase MoeA [Pirellula sp.]|nr:molybdopterin molybdotransferase MoeA [Pirellula sp.]